MDSTPSSHSEAPKVAGVILAAGESKRMGHDKALLAFGHETFLQHLVHTIGPRVSPLVVVLGSHAKEIEEKISLQQDVVILLNPDYVLGQLSSLQVALRHLSGLSVEAALVALVDHPAITPTVVETLLERFHLNRSPVLIPTFEGRRGHPTLFAKPLFQELLDAPLEDGARFVVRRHAAEIELVETLEEGILLDIDYPADYQALCKRFDLLGSA